MGRTFRVLATALAIAGGGIAASQTGAIASQQTDTCTHGIAYNNSGHLRVEYLGARNTDGQHIHNYRHVTWTGVNHERERNC